MTLFGLELLALKLIVKYWWVSAAVGGAAALAAAVWAHARMLFQQVVIPAVRTHLGDGTADLLAQLVTFVDTPLSAVRHEVAQLYARARAAVRGVSTEYTLEEDDGVRCRTEVYTEEGGALLRVATVEVVSNLSDLPPHIQEAARRAGVGAGTEVDHLDDLHLAVQAKANEIGITLN